MDIIDGNELRLQDFAKIAIKRSALLVAVVAVVSELRYVLSPSITGFCILTALPAARPNWTLSIFSSHSLAMPLFSWQ